VNFLDPVQIFPFLKGRCHGNQFCGKITYPLHLLVWHSDTEWDIATSMCALTAQIMPLSSSSYKKFLNFGSVTPEKTGLICELFVRHGKKPGVFSWISQDILDQFLRSFHHIKAPWVQIIELYLVFRFVKGRCHGNQLILGKCHERRLIPLAFFALLLENELQYHCLNVRINSSDNVATSCKNLVNFCWAVTPEIMELICVPRYLYLVKIDLHICIADFLLENFMD